MATEKPRFSITLDEDLFEMVENYRFQNRFQTRSQATVDLIRLGLEYLKLKDNEGKSKNDTNKPTDKEIIAAIEEQDHYQLVAFGGAKEQRIVSKEKTLESKKILEEMEKKREEKALLEKRILQEMEENRTKRNKD